MILNVLFVLFILGISLFLLRELKGKGVQTGFMYWLKKGFKRFL
jgi:hypothetical protein